MQDTGWAGGQYGRENRIRLTFGTVSKLRSKADNLDAAPLVATMSVPASR